MKLRERDLTILGRRLHVVDGIGKHASNIVFVPGICVSSRYMLPLATELSSAHNVYVLDMPGFGQSQLPKEGYSMDQLGQTLRSFIQQEKLSNVTVFANSFGCQITLNCIQSHPDSISRAVLAGPTFDARHRSYIAQVWRLIRDMFVEPVPLIGVLIKDLWDCGPLQVLRAVHIGLNDRPENRLRYISAPLLLIRGEKDYLAPRHWLEQLNVAAKNSIFVEIPNTAHALNFSAPKELAGIINKFIGKDL